MTDRQTDIMGHREVTLPIIEKILSKSIFFHKLVNLFTRNRMPVGKRKFAQPKINELLKKNTVRPRNVAC